MAMAQNITVIPARRTIGTQKKAEKVQKTRVAAYCRVSTEFEEQESSYPRTGMPREDSVGGRPSCRDSLRREYGLCQQR